jgi:predicted DNA-binding transcriptional regulator YafY
MRADRLLTILFMLQASDRLTARQLAAAVEVSERTIYRDIDALCAAGVPIISELGPGGGFALPANYRISANQLTLDEARALLLMAVAGPLRALGLDQALAAAQRKLVAALPVASRQTIEQDRQRLYIDTIGWEAAAETTPYLPIVHAALANDRELDLRYTTERGEHMVCYLRPYGLVAKAGTWYLVGSVADELAILPVGAIREAVMTNQRFVRPQSFDLAACWEQWCRAQATRRSRPKVTVYVAHVRMPLSLSIIGAERYQLLRNIHRQPH